MMAYANTDNTALRVLLGLLGIAVVGIVLQWIVVTTAVNLELLTGYVENHANTVFRINVLVLLLAAFGAYVAWVFAE